MEGKRNFVMVVYGPMKDSTSDFGGFAGRKTSAVRQTALALTVLTGFSGLVYEVAWQKYLATLLGSHSEATAAILAIFLGGLSLGYSLFGRVTQVLTAA